MALPKILNINKQIILLIYMHVKLRKKYGQNFLIDKEIINKIINLINYNKINI